MIRVLVAEDSAVAREYLLYLLGRDPAVEVVGVAHNGLEAVELTHRLRPDVIVMDLHMPQMDGLTATRRIMEQVPTPVVVVSASLDHTDLDATFETLHAGALTVVEKPTGLGHSDQEQMARHLVQTLKLMADVKVVRRRAPRSVSSALVCAPPARAQPLRVIAIGASTGGPEVLAEILGSLPAELKVPVLVVQHIAAGFIADLAEWLNSSCRLRVQMAAEGEPAQSGSVYIAPDGLQMGIERDGRIRLRQGPDVAGFCPSVTYLMQSVAAAFGSAVMGILLTGMGRDGAAGLLRISQTGGITIAQDEASCVVFGMPAEAIRIGAAQQILSPTQIVRAILRYTT